MTEPVKDKTPLFCLKLFMLEYLVAGNGFFTVQLIAGANRNVAGD